MNCRWIIGLLMVCAPSFAAGQQKVAPSSPTQAASGGVLQDGMPIKLQLLNKLDSHMAKSGDRIEFEPSCNHGLNQEVTASRLNLQEMVRVKPHPLRINLIG